MLKQRLIAERVNAVYETLERPLVRPLMRMERRGISVDRQTLSRLSGDFAQSAARLEAEIQEMAGEPINPGSPKQLGDIMFGKMGLPGGAKTKTGAWSTSAQILDELAEAGHDFPKKILEWRQVTKLKSTYTDSLPGFINPTTHRVHTSYALAVDNDRPAVVERSEPAEHSGAHRGRPQNPQSLRRDARPQAGVGRLFADRAAAAG